jgi:hypothetical protein
MERFHLEKRKSISGPDAITGDLPFDVEKPKEEFGVSEEITPDISTVPENLEYSEADIKERERIVNKCKLKDSSNIIKDEDGEWRVIDLYGIKMKPDDYYDLYVSKDDSGDYDKSYKKPFTQKTKEKEREILSQEPQIKPERRLEDRVYIKRGRYKEEVRYFREGESPASKNKRLH